MNNFFKNINSKVQEFMKDRNGADRLAIWTFGASMIFMIINLFMPNIICSILGYALFFYCIYRMFSKKNAYREEEENRFNDFLDRFKPGSKKKKDSGFTTRKSSNSKTYDSTKTTFVCEECGQSLSVPKGRGKLKITCPKCNHQQIVKS